MLVEGDGNHNENSTELAYHKCSDHDFEVEFWDPDPNSIHLIEHAKENKSMYCLDGTDKEGNKIDFRISGSDE